MLALFLDVAATAGWIAFDVAISVETYPIMPSYKWWMFVLGGAALVILTGVVQILEYETNQKYDQKHSHEHTALTVGTISVFDQLKGLAATLQ